MLSLMIGLMYLDLGTAYHTIQDRISFLFYVAAFMVFMAIAVLPFCTWNCEGLLHREHFPKLPNGRYHGPDRDQM